jgi:hypothetical protein
MINAVILLNDELDEVSHCPNPSRTHEHKGTLPIRFLLSVSIPKPLFPSNSLQFLQSLSRRISDDIASLAEPCRDKPSEECVSDWKIRANGICPFY